MFSGCSSLSSLDLSGLDTSKVTDMSDMFYGCSKLSSVTLGEAFSFSGAGSSRLCSLPSGAWHAETGGAYFNENSIPNGVADTYVRDGDGMSGTCVWKLDGGELVVWPVSGSEGTLGTWSSYDGAPWYPRRSEITSARFEGTVRAQTCRSMFDDCSSLSSLDLSGLDTSKVTDMSSMFSGCSKLSSVKLGKGFSFCGAGSERLCSLPDGIWTRVSDRRMFRFDRIPNKTVNTYNRTVIDRDIKNAAVSMIPAQTVGVSEEVWTRYEMGVAKFSFRVTYMPEVVPSLVIGGYELVEGEDFECSYDDEPYYSKPGSSEYEASTEPRKVTVTITGVGLFTGTKTVTYMAMFPSIADVTVTGVPKAASATKTVVPTLKYNGFVREYVGSVDNDRFKLWNGFDYTYSISKDYAKGVATITIKGKKYFRGTRKVTYRLTDMPIGSAKVTLPASSYAFDGRAKTPVPTVKMGTAALRKGTDYTVSYKNNVNAGTATVTINGKGKYTGTKSVTFKIGPAAISKATVAAIADQPYTGKVRTPKPVVKLGGKTLKEGTDYTLFWSNNVEVSNKAKVTIKGKGNYAGSKTVAFRVSFKDVAKSHPFYDKIHRANDLGIIKGYGGGKFGPSDSIARGQIAVMLWGVAGKKKVSGGKAFPDVKSGAYYYDAVMWASSVGVVSGYADGSFGPNDNITREQLAVMVANYAKKLGGQGVSGSKADLSKLADASSVSGYAVPAVAWCYRKGVFVPQSGKLNPTKTADRATAAQMAYDLYELLR